MSKYRMVGVPHGVGAGLVEGRVPGEEFDADFSEEQERALAGAGAIERVEGDTFQPDMPGPGSETMDAPPHTADPGVGFQDVEDEPVGAEPE